MLGSADTTSKSRAHNPTARARRVPDAQAPSHNAYTRLAPGTPKSPGQGSESSHPMDLAAVVECEIIPRLMLAHTSDLDHAAPLGARGAEIGPDVVDVFARLALDAEAERMLNFVSELMATGRSLQAVYLDLLAPAARRLGVMWSDDEVAYSDVTIALGRLQHLIRLLGWKIPLDKDAPASRQTVLFAPAPGEQHSFGLIMIEDHFRRAGWRTWLETQADPDSVAQIVAQHWFDVVGFSLSNASMAKRLAVVVRRTRAMSKNRDVFIMVGGYALEQDPLLLETLGADATAVDGFQALTIAGERVCHGT